jgi:hypothetical protein
VPPILRAEWVDLSPAADGRDRLPSAKVPALLSGGPPRTDRTAPPGPGRRYFGPGDVVRNASLIFSDRSTVEIDSFFQQCSFTLADETELVVGPQGVLADCTITGGGRITVHGQFYEGQSPGIDRPQQVRVSASGLLVGSIRQGSAGTRFAFEAGSRLRLKILRAETARGDGEGVSKQP